MYYSSLYLDEDGDLAHEFYEETIVTKNGRKRAKLKRIQKNLIPQVCSMEEKSIVSHWTRHRFSQDVSCQTK
jgi:hypothetical protein